MLGALGLIFSRKAVHSALCLCAVMICLALFYMAQGAVFLGVVQIVVYTGAIMMLFLFVLMLIGVDSAESLAETIRGQRWAAVLVAVVFGAILLGVFAHAQLGPFKGLDAANASAGGNVQSLARLLFSRYFLAFEVTSALLIIAALGAMVLAHRERVTPRKSQQELAADRFRRYGRDSVDARHGPLPTPASTPSTTRSTPRRCCPTAASPSSASTRRCARTATRATSGRCRSRCWPTRDRRTGLRAAGRRRDDRRERGGRGMNPANYLYLSAILFTIGAVGVLVRRNAIVVFMCVELMLNAVNLPGHLLPDQRQPRRPGHRRSSSWSSRPPRSWSGLAIIMTIFRTRRSASVDDANLLKY